LVFRHEKGVKLDCLTPFWEGKENEGFIYFTEGGRFIGNM